MTDAEEQKIAAKFNVPHLLKEGARFHVHSYSLVRSRKRFDDFALTWCGEAFCEDNRRSVLACIAEGHDPAALHPCVAAKEWLRGLKLPVPA